jgi:hypothetical protein
MELRGELSGELGKDKPAWVDARIVVTPMIEEPPSPPALPAAGAGQATTALLRTELIGVGEKIPVRAGHLIDEVTEALATRFSSAGQLVCANQIVLPPNLFRSRTLRQGTLPVRPLGPPRNRGQLWSTRPPAVSDTA